MRYVAFILAAVFSLAAIAGQWLGWPQSINIPVILLAGACLVWGFFDIYSKQEAKPIELDDAQRATIKRMKEEGNHQLAIQQVQMWFRNPPAEEAARIVREV